MEPPAARGKKLPTVPLNPHDMTVLDAMLASYLAYLRGAVVFSHKHAAQIQAVEGLRRRLAMVPPATQGTPFLLTFAEVEALDRAVEGYMRLYRRSVPKSNEREAVLKRLEDFRQELGRMLYPLVD